MLRELAGGAAVNAQALAAIARSALLRRPTRVVARRRFQAEEFIAGLAAERVTTTVVVPGDAAAHLRARRRGDSRPRHLGAADRVLRRRQLPGPVATKTLELFGHVLYVLCGSTEVAYASISTPADHRAAPTTVGRITLGTTVRLLDERGEEVPRGEAVRIFISNGIEFGGYTDGRNKEVIDGGISSGDVGHRDSEGRLFIDGRDDEMIVSGGENVFPQEVEELLIARAEVADVAVIGVDDPDFGQRLAAFVVPASSPGGEELRSHVSHNLARFRVPREVHSPTSCPATPPAILKRELAASLADPDPN